MIYVSLTQIWLFFFSLYYPKHVLPHTEEPHISRSLPVQWQRSLFYMASVFALCPQTLILRFFLLSYLAPQCFFCVLMWVRVRNRIVAVVTRLFFNRTSDSEVNISYLLHDHRGITPEWKACVPEGLQSLSECDLTEDSQTTFASLGDRLNRTYDP